jgi:hypothetical protein
MKDVIHIKNLLSAEEVKLLSIWTEIKHRINGTDFDFKQGENADSMFYGTPLTDAILLKTTPAVSKEIGLPILPSYSFVRVYTKFSELKKHLDRESCEISATVHIGSDGTEWPIFIGEEKLLLKPGDGVIYNGTKIPHWREEFLGDWYVNVFLHWVLADGKYKDFYMDKRKYFGLGLAEQ